LRIATIAVGGRASQQRIMKAAKEFPRHCEPTGPAQSGGPMTGPRSNPVFPA
jgi:hypothetical protein